MIFNNKESRRLTADEIAKGRPREAYRNITYNSIDDIEPEDLFEKFQKLLNESDGYKHRSYVKRMQNELWNQHKRVKKESKEPHIRSFHFNETDTTTEEEDEAIAQKMKEDLEKNLGIRVFLRKMVNNQIWVV